MNVWLVEIWRAWRASLRRPGFLLLASGVLALGIGASVAVFALIQNTLWRPSAGAAGGAAGGARADARQRARGRHLTTRVPVSGSAAGPECAGSGAFRERREPGRAGAPAQVPAIFIDRTVLSVLGLRPLLGRNFSALEDQPDGPKAVLIAHGLWQRLSAVTRHVIGRTVHIEGVPYPIVGVLPGGFNSVLGPGDVVLPMALPTASRDYNHNGDIAIGRLRAGVAVASVCGAGRCARAHHVPGHGHGWELEPAPLSGRTAGGGGPAGHAADADAVPGLRRGWSC